MFTKALNFHDLYERITESGCWIWTGGLNSDGYGYFSARGQGESPLAHRLSYRLFRGPVPRSIHVCHSCDIPCCINPSHLFLGTNIENTADKTRKQRQTRGERIQTAKLTEADVHAILACNESCAAIAKRYGVTDCSISNIKTGKTWKHIVRPIGFKYEPRKHYGRAAA